MGSVYLAQNAEGGPYVALKMIRHDLASDADFRRRFRSEVARAQSVPAFCTAEVLDADSDFDPPYLVVEFVRGPSLNRVVQDQGPLSPANLHGLAIGVATALTGIHGAGVIHRDLKPANVLLSLAGPKVIDFGIARAPEGTALTDTGSNQLIGTIPYMAPERLDAGLRMPLTAAADVFSWGAVVCFAGTGRTPFTGGNGVETAARILTQPPDLTGLSGLLRSLTEQALAKNPGDRPTARELLDELVGSSARIEAASRQAVVTVAPLAPAPTAAAGIAPPRAASMPTQSADVDGQPTVPQRKRRKVALPLLATLTVLLAVAVGGFLSGAIKPPWNLSANPESTPSVTDSPSSLPSPSASSSAAPASPSASGSASPVPSKTPFAVEPLTEPRGYWVAKDESDIGLGKCSFASALVARLEKPGPYKCPGDRNELKDFSAEVEVSLTHADSCAAIWTRYKENAGYLLQVCPKEYTLYSHSTAVPAFIRSALLPAPIPLKTKFKVRIEHKGSKISVFHNGTEMFTVANETTFPDRGAIRLGIFVKSSPTKPMPYEVAYNNLVVYDLAS
jgi:serine/threonine protein kinase